MDKLERANMILAMERVVRGISDESHLYGAWLDCGVPDGEINKHTSATEIMEDDYWMDDDNFADIMALFARIMARATKESKDGYGIFYVDKVESKRKEI